MFNYYNINSFYAESISEMLLVRVPFRVLGLDSDNGPEFINYHLFHWCEKREIQFTRRKRNA